MDDLSVQYNAIYWCNRFSPEDVLEHHGNFTKTGSDKVQSTIPCERNISYGESKGEKLDVYGTDLPDDAPVIIFIRGGFWQCLSKDVSCFMAGNFHDLGFRTIVLEYDNCPDVEITKIIEEVNKGVKFSIDYARSKGSRGVHIIGHSAGGHLAACVFTSQLPPEDYKMIKQVVIISGICDMRPLLEVPLAKPIKLTPVTAASTSPLLNEIICLNKDTKFKVFVGDVESPAALWQSGLLLKKFEDSGLKTEMVVLPGEDHFSTLEILSEPDSLIVKSVVSDMN